MTMIVMLDAFRRISRLFNGRPPWSLFTAWGMFAPSFCQVAALQHIYCQPACLLTHQLVSYKAGGRTGRASLHACKWFAASAVLYMNRSEKEM